MLIAAVETVWLSKPIMLLMERVVVDDWMSVSSSVAQRVFAEVLRNNNEWW